ncbi:4a-hydroxytetrahydrobiopterin dehydratase [Actinomadura rupiterrae]|uniref:4a-hydroxytetrahydrobiopterin dehydratase n=1 Tax=Actinomadura rupiterrae TaxID=559627 RepID=UPI0020A47F75|nr:4a-hydroxytetrahydrobiopterin dehydratase [Actinomadura rupiterrae]MCP2343260.1 4a-hydroxytetrahydrobiopterin dehydratase [Actinomadura rupiterrae]
MPDLLDEAAVAGRLKELPGWSLDGREIRREFEAPSFAAGIELVVAVAADAEEANHHPDIDVRWTKVTFTLSTHSEGGLTHLDFDAARRIDGLAVEHGAR